MALPNEKILELVKGSGLLKEANLKKVDDLVQKSKNSNLATALIEAGILTEEQMGAIIAGGYNVPFISLSKVSILPEVARIIPDKVAKRTKSFTFARGPDGVKVALADPSNKAVLSMVARKTGERAIPYFAFEKDIEGVAGLYKKALQKTIDELLREYVKQFAIGGEAPIAKVVDQTRNIMLIPIHSPKRGDSRRKIVEYLRIFQ